MSNLALDHGSEFEPASESEIAAMQELRPVPRISIQAFCETDSVAKRWSGPWLTGDCRVPT